MILDKLGSMIIQAELRAPHVPVIPKTIKWEDDTEENRNNPKIMWITNSALNKKYRFIGETPEEKEYKQKQKEKKLRFMFDYIRENYGWEYAEIFYLKVWENIFKRDGVEIDLTYPHCQYTKDGQCDLLCPYFSGKCNN